MEDCIMSIFEINNKGYLNIHIDEAVCQRAPFIRLIINGNEEQPSSVLKKEKLYRFIFDTFEGYVDILKEEKDNYTTFEAIDLNINTASDVEALLWGPIEIPMTEVIGESIGVIQHGNKAVGMQVLNPKTLGGWPKNYLDLGYAHEEKGNITRYPYHECVAWPLKEVSILQAYTRNWERDRFQKVMECDIPQQVIKFSGSDAKIRGSKIALFYCNRQHILDTIATIEVGEGLPHPMIEGEWGKISNEATRSYLISDFDESNMMEAAQFAKLAGFKYIYHGDPWHSWGHFHMSLLQGANQLRACIDTLEEKEGIRVGAHMLSNFIHGHDAYVSPVPDERLLTIGSTILTREVDGDSKNIYVKDDTYFHIDMSGRFIKECIIGKEIIKYLTVEQIDDNEYMLGDCIRGHRGTKQSSYNKDETISRLSTHYYNTLFPNLDLQKDVIDNLTDAYNKSGMKQISFDGLEGGRYLGYGDYGCNVMVHDFYEKLLDKSDFVNDASIVTPYLWHIHTRMNWGEPWGETMREGMIDVRYENQDYFRRNFLPPMLGWFIVSKGTPMIDIEWMLSKAAGFESGFALYTKMKELKTNGLSKEICEKVNQWETARLQGAFTEDQRCRLRVRENEWHLEEIVPGEKWTLQKVAYPTKPLIKKFDEFQPGSTGVDWPFTNDFQEQPFQFELQVLDGGRISNPGFLLPKGAVAFQTEIEEGQYLVYHGDQKAIKYDCYWHELEQVKAYKSKEVIYVEGQQMISLSADNWENPDGYAKVRLITMDEAEQVFIGNETN